MTASVIAGTTVGTMNLEAQVGEVLDDFGSVHPSPAWTTLPVWVRHAAVQAHGAAAIAEAGEDALALLAARGQWYHHAASAAAIRTISWDALHAPNSQQRLLDDAHARRAQARLDALTAYLTAEARGEKLVCPVPDDAAEREAIVRDSRALDQALDAAFLHGPQRGRAPVANAAERIRARSTRGYQDGPAMTEDARHARAFGATTLAYLRSASPARLLRESRLQLSRVASAAWAQTSTWRAKMAGAAIPRGEAPPRLVLPHVPLATPVPTHPEVSGLPSVALGLNPSVTAFWRARFQAQQAINREGRSALPGLDAENPVPVVWQAVDPVAASQTHPPTLDLTASPATEGIGPALGSARRPVGLRVPVSSVGAAPGGSPASGAPESTTPPRTASSEPARRSGTRPGGPGSQRPR